MEVCSVSCVSSEIICVRPKDSDISLMCLVFPENMDAEPSVEFDFTERSQSLFPNRIISVPDFE